MLVQLSWVTALTLMLLCNKLTLYLKDNQSVTLGERERKGDGGRKTRDRDRDRERESWIEHPAGRLCNIDLVNERQLDHLGYTQCIVSVGLRNVKVNLPLFLMKEEIVYIVLANFHMQPISGVTVNTGV